MIRIDRVPPLPELRRRLGQVHHRGVAHHWFSTYHARPWSRVPLSLSPSPVPANAPTLVNIANFAANAGDILLPIAHRDLISQRLGRIRWQARHAHHVVTRRRVMELNRARGVVIGGGGLLFSDTNRNGLSGWQWSCSLQALEQIRSPIAMVGVGYNQFPGQAGFSTIFDEHINRLVEKAVFIGLRNSGSISALSHHLPPNLHSKLRLQPCATTLLASIYPDLLPATVSPDGRYIALNAAFDHIDMRLGDLKDQTFRELAKAMRDLSRDIEVRFIAHRSLDEEMLGYLDAEGVPYRLVHLYDCEPIDIIHAYAGAATVIGMRGHAQLIPFGCGRPIISLISHNKMRYFLEDIAATDWGIDLKDADLRTKLVGLARAQLSDARAENRVSVAAANLHEITSDNLTRLAEGFGFIAGSA